MIVVWFSCGAASAVAAKMTLDQYQGLDDVRVVNTPIAEEDIDNRRFLMDVQDWIGVRIETAVNPKFPTNSAQVVWEKEKFMSSPFGAPCTRSLKKEARYIWEAQHHPDFHVLGFTADEKPRHDRFVLTERDNVIPVLIRAGITKQNCYQVVTDAGIRLPRSYGQGYPNANCKGCVKVTSPTYWNHVRREDFEVFQERASQSRRLGSRLVIVKGKRVFLDELDPNAVGRPMKGMDVECGIFCEEKP